MHLEFCELDCNYISLLCIRFSRQNAKRIKGTKLTFINNNVFLVSFPRPMPTDITCMYCTVHTTGVRMPIHSAICCMYSVYASITYIARNIDILNARRSRFSPFRLHNDHHHHPCSVLCGFAGPK